MLLCPRRPRTSASHVVTITWLKPKVLPRRCPMFPASSSRKGKMAAAQTALLANKWRECAMHLANAAQAQSMGQASYGGMYTNTLAQGPAPYQPGPYQPQGGPAPYQSQWGWGDRVRAKADRGRDQVRSRA